MPKADMTETEDLLRALQDAFASEVDLYRQLEALSARQLNVLETDDPDVELVAQIMREKHDLSIQLTELESKHSPLRERYEAIRETVPESQKSALIEQKAVLDELLPRLLDMEKRGEERVKACGRDIERQLRLIWDTRAARNAYGAYARQATPPRFFDKKK